MIITDINQNTKNKSLVFIDGKLEFILSNKLIKKLDLYVNKTINEDMYQYIKYEIIYPEAKKKSLNYIAYQPRTKLEIEKYLKNFSYDEKIIIQVINFLNKYNYINDFEYAKLYIESKINRNPLGKKILIYNLHNKGINNDIIEKVFSKLNFDEDKYAYELIQKKIVKKAKLNIKDETKLYNYLTQKGFEYTSIKNAVNKYKNSLIKD